MFYRNCFIQKSSVLLIIALTWIAWLGFFDVTRAGPEQEDRPEAGSEDKPLTLVPGTKIRMIKPEGFEVADQFTGFGKREDQASIMITELPGPFPEITEGFNEEGLVAQGMTLLQREELKLNDVSALLLHVDQNLVGTTFSRWITVFGDEKATVMVNATYPKDLEKRYSEPLREAVLSVRWERDLQVDPFADLPFEIDVAEPLQYAHRVSNMLLYTEGGEFPLEEPTGPFFVVGSAISNVDVVDQKEFSERRIKSTVSVLELEIDSSEPIIVDELSGQEIVAKAIDATTDQPMVLYQVIFFQDKTYFIMQGLVTAEASERFLPMFQKAARNFQRKAKPDR